MTLCGGPRDARGNHQTAENFRRDAGPSTASPGSRAGREKPKNFNRGFLGAGFARNPMTKFEIRMTNQIRMTQTTNSIFQLCRVRRSKSTARQVRKQSSARLRGPWRVDELPPAVMLASIAVTIAQRKKALKTRQTRAPSKAHNPHKGGSRILTGNAC